MTPKFSSEPSHQPDRSPYNSALTAMDGFIRTLRRHRNPSQLLSSLDQFLALQSALEDTSNALAGGQLPPEPLRSNYRARLQTLAFELHRLEPLLQQEHSRLSQTLHNSTARRAWLETLSTTQ